MALASGGDLSHVGANGQVSLLFVCLGNICRSPTAEGVMRSMVEREGLADRYRLDSAGTGSWHIGSPPDARATAAAAARGIPLRGPARQVLPEDYESFDLLLAMDADNHAELLRLAPDAQGRARVRMLREFDPVGEAAGTLEVPDPYYGGERGFEEVLDLVQAACEGLLRRLQDGAGESAR